MNATFADFPRATCDSPAIADWDEVLGNFVLTRVFTFPDFDSSLLALPFCTRQRVRVMSTSTPPTYLTDQVLAPFRDFDLHLHRVWHHNIDVIHLNQVLPQSVSNVVQNNCGTLTELVSLAFPLIGLDRAACRSMSSSSLSTIAPPSIT